MHARISGSIYYLPDKTKREIADKEFCKNKLSSTYVLSFWVHSSLPFFQVEAKNGLPIDGLKDKLLKDLNFILTAFF